MVIRGFLRNVKAQIRGKTICLLIGAVAVRRWCITVGFLLTHQKVHGAEDKEAADGGSNVEHVRINLEHRLEKVRAVPVLFDEF